MFALFHTFYLSLSPTLLLPSLPSLFRYAVCEDLSALIPVLHNTTTVARETSRALQRGATRGDASARVPRSEDHNPGTYIPMYTGEQSQCMVHSGLSVEDPRLFCFVHGSLKFTVLHQMHSFCIKF